MPSKDETQPDEEIQQTQEDLMARLVSNQLKQAKQAIKENNLVEAKTFLEKALQVPGRRPEREANIRQIIHQYSAEYAQTRPKPRWGLAHQTLDLLTDLELTNHQVQEWRRELRLEEARFQLNQQDFSQSVATFAALLKETEPAAKRPLERKITVISRDYIDHHVAVDDWPLLHPLTKGFQSLEPALPELQAWLKTIEKLLSAAEAKEQEHLEKFQTMEQALAERKERIAHLNQQTHECHQTVQQLQQTLNEIKASAKKNSGLVTQQKQEIEQLTAQLKQQQESQKRYQMYNGLLLAGIFITLAVAYGVILIL